MESIKKMYEIHVESTLEVHGIHLEVHGIHLEVHGIYVEMYGIHVKFMEQNHSIWIPPGMWGHSKVLLSCHNVFHFWMW